MNPEFIAKRYELHNEVEVGAAAERIFPLLCPVRESEWIPGWTCQMIFGHSGLAEKDCVFVTRQAGEPATVWVNSLHDPQALVVEYIRITPDIRLVRIRIGLAALTPDSCRMEFGFAYTALGEPGNRELQTLAEQDGREARELCARLAAQLDCFLKRGHMLQ